MSNQPPPFIAPLDDTVPVADRVYVNTSVWRLFFQGLQATINNITGAFVASFNGRSGAVTAQSGDYTVAEVTGAVGEAPLDGQIYGRKNGAWVVVGSSSPPASWVDNSGNTWVDNSGNTIVT